MYACWYAGPSQNSVLATFDAEVDSECRFVFDALQGFFGNGGANAQYAKVSRLKEWCDDLVSKLTGNGE